MKHNVLASEGTMQQMRMSFLVPLCPWHSVRSSIKYRSPLLCKLRNTPDRVARDDSCLWRLNYQSMPTTSLALSSPCIDGYNESVARAACNASLVDSRCFSSFVLATLLIPRMSGSRQLRASASLHPVEIVLATVQRDSM